jgi:hypothetical protein
MEIAVIVGAVAILIGWHVSRAHMNHRGIPIRRGQLHDYRRDRMRSGFRMTVVAVILIMILVVIALH